MSLTPVREQEEDDMIVEDLELENGQEMSTKRYLNKVHPEPNRFEMNDSPLIDFNHGFIKYEDVRAQKFDEV